MRSAMLSSHHLHNVHHPAGKFYNCEHQSSTLNLPGDSLYEYIITITQFITFLRKGLPVGSPL